MTAVESSSASSRREDVSGETFGLTWHQQYQAARLVASASTDAAACALLLSALGIHPADVPLFDGHREHRPDDGPTERPASQQVH